MSRAPDKFIQSGVWITFAQKIHNLPRGGKIWEMMRMRFGKSLLLRTAVPDESYSSRQDFKKKHDLKENLKRIEKTALI